MAGPALASVEQKLTQAGPAAFLFTIMNEVITVIRTAAMLGALPFLIAFLGGLIIKVALIMRQTESYKR